MYKGHKSEYIYIYVNIFVNTTENLTIQIQSFVPSFFGKRQSIHRSISNGEEMQLHDQVYVNSACHRSISDGV